MSGAKIIATVAEKGGTAKTTTTLNLGAALQRTGKKVLYIDADPKPDLTSTLRWSQEGLTLADLMLDVLNKDMIRSGRAIQSTKDGMDYIPGCASIAEMDANLSSIQGSEYILRKILNTVRNKYDYVLIDAPPNKTVWHVNILAAADSVIIPIQAQPYAVENLHKIVHHINVVKGMNVAPDLSVEGVVITMVNPHTRLGRKCIAEIKSRATQMNIKIFQSIIPFSIKQTELSDMRKSIYQHAPSSSSAVAYTNLAKEVMGDGRSEKILAR